MKTIRTMRGALCALLISLLATACDESDTVSVRLTVGRDFSGRVTTSALRIPAPAAPLEHEGRGVQWDSRVQLVATSGTFSRLSELVFEDVTFGAGPSGERLDYAEVKLPRGPDARWPRNLVPLSEEERVRAASTLDPEGNHPDAGRLVKFELSLPGRVIGHGLTARAHGAREKAEGNVATLTIPIESTLDDAEPLIWHVTWRRPDE